MVYVYDEEFEIRDCQLSLTEHENLEELLDDYLDLHEMISECEEDKKPLEKKIIKLQHKVSLIDKAKHDLKWKYWLRHLKDLEHVSNMNNFICSPYTTLETEIRKLAFKREEEK